MHRVRCVAHYGPHVGRLVGPATRSLGSALSGAHGPSAAYARYVAPCIPSSTLRRHARSSATQLHLCHADQRRDSDANLRQARDRPRSFFGVAPETAFDQIDVAEKGYVRREDRDRQLDYQGFTIDQKAWGNGADSNGNPIDWLFLTFTTRKDWAPEEIPVATDVGREWNILEADGISGATMVETLAMKHGPRSNGINKNCYYYRSGQVLADALGCPGGMPQPLRSNYLLSSEIGEEEITVTCGSILTAYLVTATGTGRASLRKSGLGRFRSEMGP